MNTNYSQVLHREIMKSYIWMNLRKTGLCAMDSLCRLTFFCVNPSIRSVSKTLDSDQQDNM